MATDTQLESWEEVKKNLTKRQRQVFEVIEKAPSTGCEVGWKLNAAESAWVTARIAELRHLGLVEDSTERRRNLDSKKNNIIWRRCDSPKPVEKVVTAKAWATLDDKGRLLRVDLFRFDEPQTACIVRYTVVKKPVQKIE